MTTYAFEPDYWCRRPGCYAPQISAGTVHGYCVYHYRKWRGLTPKPIENKCASTECFAVRCDESPLRVQPSGTVGGYCEEHHASYGADQ